MPDRFGGRGRGGSRFQDPDSSPDRGPLGFVGNLVGDVKDTVMGLPMGVIESVRNPIKSAKAVGGATWQTWSPLFHGDIGKFGKQLYDHPLAPLLDVATVFTLGAGGAARGANALGKVGVESARLEKVAGLTKPKAITLHDPKGEKLPVDRNLSTRAGRRLLQEVGMAGPSWYTTPRNAMRFRHLDLVRDSGLVKATHEIHAAAIMQAAKVVTDPETAPRALQEVAGGMYAGLLRHNTPVSVAEAERLIKGGHYGYTADVRHIDQQSSRLLNRARREEKVWQRQREQHAELANELPKIEKELADAQRALEQIESGHHPAIGAAMKGEFPELPGERAANKEALRSRRERARFLDISARELRDLEEKAASYPEVKARHDRIAGRGEVDLADYQHYGLSATKRGKLAGDRTALTGRAQRELAEAAEAQDRLAALNHALERTRIEGYKAAKGQRVSRAESVKVGLAKEQAAIVKSLEQRLDKAHKSKAAHDKAVGEIERVTEWRTALETRSYADYFRKASGSLEDFTKWADNFGSQVHADTLAKAARPKVIRDGKWVDDDTRVYIHRRHDADMLGVEAKNSASFLGKAYRETTGLWKTIQLGYTPRTVTNNAVGNWLLAATRDNPVAAAIGLYDAIRITKGNEAALEAVLGGTKRATPFRRNHWMYRYFGDELGNTFKQTLADETGRMPSKLRQGLYPLVHKLSDEPVRMAVISAFLRKSPEVKALKKRGLPTDAAIHKALRKHPHLRDQAANHARTTAGDYYTMRPFERTVRDLVPFYLWDRHIAKTAGNMFADTPGRVALAQRVGSLGIERTEEILGELPEFLRGAIPLGKKGDRAVVGLTSSLNPFATLGELAAATQGLTTGGGLRDGAAVLSQFNPLVTGGIEAATGRSILTGAEKAGHGGLIPTLAINTAMGFPQVRAGKALLTPDSTETDTGESRLYAADDMSPITSLLGIPLRNISLERAAQMAERDKPKKKKRKKPSRFDS